MRPLTMLRLAQVLVTSQLRGSGRGRPATSRFGQPKVLLYVDLAGFALSVALPLFVLRSVPPGMLAFLGNMTIEALIGLPAFITSTLLLIGVLWEISAPYRFTSSDTINWLPLEPSEYVLASTVSSVYTYSVLLAIGWGVTLSLALTFHLEPLWVLSASMSLVAAIIAGFAVEILRSLTNRVSSSFYRRGGRSVLAIRLVVTVVALIVFQVIFNANIMLPLLQALVGAVYAFWFIPVLWPALLVQRAYQADVISAAALTAAIPAFTAALFLAARALRTRYWMPLPVSVRVTNAVYAPRRGPLGRLGLGPVEAAITRKDLRSLTRRREMARFLAIPVAILIPFFIQFAQVPGQQVGRETMVLIPIMAPFFALFTLILAMTSIGQEGQAVVNVYASPILPSQFLGGKLFSSLLVSLPFNVVLTALLLTVSGAEPELWGAFTTVTLSLTVESAFIGLAIGCSQPDFTEGPRTRFVSMKGWIVAQLVFWGSALSSVAPVAFYVFSPGFASRIGLELPVAVAIALGVAALVSVLTYRYAVGAAHWLFQELRA